MRSRRSVLLIFACIFLLGSGVWSDTRGPKASKARALPAVQSPALTTTTTATTVPGDLNIYAAAGADMLSPAVAGVPYRLYVPQSAGSGVDVVDPTTFRVVDHYTTGLDPQHVVPSWDLQTLYATNTLADTLTPIDPVTGKPKGPNITVADPYNLYFTVDGTSAIVVAEAQQRLDFRDPHTFELQQGVPVDCRGVDHIDFSADGSYLIATCEFSGRLVKVDVKSRSVLSYLDLPGGSPQDIKLDPTGRVFFVADMKLGGVHVIDATAFSVVGFVATGKDAHGLFISRDARSLYVTNRGSGTVTVIDVARRTVTATWSIPGGASPDMGGLSPDGRVLWVSGRYNKTVYALSTEDGRLLGQVAVTDKPHGLAVWPQPGRYSLGHTGVLR